MKLQCTKISPDAITPTYATDGSGAFDFYSTESAAVTYSQVFETGLAFAIPKDHIMLIFSRSGHGFNSDIRLANCVGVVDSDYRQTVKVKLTNDGSGLFKVRKGDRIAQAIVLPVARVEFDMVEALDDPGTRTGGLGSTGS
jgi:dUTP pyrophosphatase